MADSKSSCNGRKCFGFGFVRVGNWAPSRENFRSTSSVNGAPGPVPESDDNWSAGTDVVVITGVFFVLGIMVIAIILRRQRIRAAQARIAEIGNIAAKDGQGEDINNHGQWSAAAVELVVMAGETQPTFLAHPAPAAPSPPPHPIQCPPLMLPEPLPH